MPGNKPSDSCCLNFGCPKPEVCDNEIGFSCGDPRAGQKWAVLFLDEKGYYGTPQGTTTSGMGLLIGKDFTKEEAEHLASALNENEYVAATLLDA